MLKITLLCNILYNYRHTILFVLAIWIISRALQETLDEEIVTFYHHRFYFVSRFPLPSRNSISFQRDDEKITLCDTSRSNFRWNFPFTFASAERFAVPQLTFVRRSRMFTSNLNVGRKEERGHTTLDFKITISPSRAESVASFQSSPFSGN